MTYQEMEAFYDNYIETCKKLCLSKAQEYADDNNVFSSLKASEAVGLCDAGIGILIRVTDKVSRLAHIIKNEKNNKYLSRNSESLDDTVQDIINYMIMFAAVYSEQFNAGVKL